jgi:hypothetical protein
VFSKDLRKGSLAGTLGAVALVAAVWTAAQVTEPEKVVPINPPSRPLPAEAETARMSRFSFVVYGDTRGRSDGVAIQAEHTLVVDSMVTRIRKLAPTPYPVRFVLQSGDAVVDGSKPAQWNKSYVPVINRLTAEGVSYYLSPGNHDVTSAGSVDAPQRQPGLRNLLDATSRLLPPEGSPRRLAGYATYAFGYGNAFVIAVDSTIAADAGQLQWVKAQLEGLDRRRYVHVFVFLHHPPFSSGPHGGEKVEPPAAQLRASYLPLFRAHHVCIVFSGHEHLYEHWVETYKDASGAHRLDHVVTGGGGAPHYGYRGEVDLSEYLKANEANQVGLVRLVKPTEGEGPYHYVIVRVDGERLSLEVVGADPLAPFEPYVQSAPPYRSAQIELQAPR